MGDIMNTIQFKILAWFRLLLYVSLFMIFILIPKAVFTAESLCFTFQKFHVICPSCGITRAFTSFIHFEWLTAIAYNQVFTLAILPITLFLFGQDTYTILVRTHRKQSRLSIIEFLFMELLR